MKKLYFFLLFVLFYSQVKATHLAAGSIYYEYLSPLTYKVHLLLYRDCKIISVGLPANAMLAGTDMLSISSMTCGQSFTINVDTTGNNTAKVVPDMCPSIINWCNDPLSTFPGYEEWHYSAVVTLPMSCDDWVFGYNSCCRNGAIGNLANPLSLGYFISAKLNTLTSSGNFNNSTQYIVGNGFNYLANQPYTINQTAIDPDGDSLVFSLTSPQNSNGSGPCPYLSTGGYSATDPLGTPTATNYANIDPLTGNLHFESALQSVDVIAINIDEYRNGILVGSTMRDLQFNFINGSPNSLPTLSGVNSTSNYYASVNVCPGATLNFTAAGSDVDLADSVIITPLTSLMGSSTFSTNNALQQTGTFSWTPTIADIRPNPYFLVLQAKDNNCHSVSYGYLIYINQCTADSVWAGDANADFTVNNYDVLNIGIGNGTTGIVRPGATTNWVAEYCTNWSSNFMSGINYKHADCNGDGSIDALDMNPVSLNYGQIHLKKENIGQYKTAGLPDLYFDLTGIIVTPGSTIQVPVMLGTGSAMMNNVYGLAGHFSVSNSLSAPLSFSNSPSWLGNVTNSFLFQKNINSNDIAFTIVRSNQTNVNGSGQIGTLTIPIDITAIPNSDLALYFSDLKMIMNDGSEITDYNVINDTLKIVSPNDVTSIYSSNNIELYPNPVNDYLTVKLNAMTTETISVSIADMLGNIVLQKEIKLNGEKEFKLNTAMLSKGTYSLQLISSAESYSAKLTK